MRKHNPAGNYTSRIEEIKEELKIKFFGEVLPAQYALKRGE
jgi:hypothetical protein